MMKIKQIAVDKLSNTMRMYVEARFNFERLKLVDKEEAINNLDRAFEAKLEAFHSLYDVTKSDFDYFEHADTALLILIRNAIHHRDHDLFISWNKEMLLNGGLERNNGAEFLLASNRVCDRPPVMQYYYKLEDVLFRLDKSLGSPFLENRMRPAQKDELLRKLDEQLKFNDIVDYAKSERYPVRQIYLNLIPIFTSAVVKVFTELKSKGFQFEGYDAKVYEEPFTNELSVDYAVIDYKPVRIWV
ncbi:hypothetical protein QNE93_004395 [Vibrio vulnificus]|uniref:hypothetical protein n=1 Tax=Vibrio vulnificus TaxID=672 RepID=UPI002878981E|nr:hypothetical protein [Vibrio vulnificus]EJT1341388.1 hypothetical protein [Vibrio vulnificus]ELV8746802.1 hypothetical protein [Vibrio vulnificus]ELV8755459.1 hypothetical protein [Vibrio vulnificus]MDS1829084.1 hypothetical protein [Vibrio vulnificus]